MFAIAWILIKLDGLNIAYKKVSFNAFAVDVWVKEGAATASKRGIAHFLEHMVFKGAHGRTWEEILSEIDSTGGVINAATSYDFTHYYSVVPFPHRVSATSLRSGKAFKNWQIALNDVLDMVFYPEFPPIEVEKEKRVVLEEYLRSQSTPGGFLFRKGFEYLFGESPYGFPILGYPDDIKSFSVRDLKKYHASYSVEDMLLVVVGNVSFKDIKTFLRGYLAGLKKEHPEYFRRDLPPTNKRFEALKKTIEKHYPRFDNVYFLLMFQGPSANSEDQVPMDIFSYMMLGGGASVLHEVLKEREELVFFVRGGFGTLKECGYFYVFGQTEKGKIDSLRKRLLEILSNPSYLNRKDFERAKNLLLSEELEDMQSLTGLTAKLGFYWSMGVPELGLNYVQKVENVSFDDVKALPYKYFSGANYVFLWTGQDGDAVDEDSHR